MGPDDQVILITHEPTWLLEWFWAHSTSSNLRQLVRGHLRGRARVHLAGDLHFYMRHSFRSRAALQLAELAGMQAAAAAATAKEGGEGKGEAAAEAGGEAMPGMDSATQPPPKAADAASALQAQPKGAQTEVHAVAASARAEAMCSNCAAAPAAAAAAPAGQQQGGAASGTSSGSVSGARGVSRSGSSASSVTGASINGLHAASSPGLGGPSVPSAVNGGLHGGWEQESPFQRASRGARGAGSQADAGVQLQAAGAQLQGSRGHVLEDSSEDSEDAECLPWGQLGQQQQQEGGAGAAAAGGGALAAAAAVAADRVVRLKLPRISIDVKTPDDDAAASAAQQQAAAPPALGATPLLLPPGSPYVGCLVHDPLYGAQLTDPEHLICNGMGGAFMHPTHVFSYARFASLPDEAAEATAGIYSTPQEKCTCRWGLLEGSTGDNDRLQRHGTAPCAVCVACLLAWLTPCCP